MTKSRGGTDDKPELVVAEFTDLSMDEPSELCKLQSMSSEEFWKLADAVSSRH